MNSAMDYRRLGALAELTAIEQEIDSIVREMLSHERQWVYYAPVPGKPDRRIRKIVSDYQADYDAALARLTHVQERKAEIERELGITEAIFYGR
jgi:hypothetical protein